PVLGRRAAPGLRLRRRRGKLLREPPPGPAPPARLAGPEPLLRRGRPGARLRRDRRGGPPRPLRGRPRGAALRPPAKMAQRAGGRRGRSLPGAPAARRSEERREGKSVDLGGRRTVKKEKVKWQEVARKSDRCEIILVARREL